MPTTLNVADKPTLNSVKTDTDTLITRGGIRHNGTNPQVYDTTNDTWVDLPSGGSLSPTIIIKNHFYEDGDMDNLDITVSDVDGLWTNTVNMGTNESITVEVLHLGIYTISCTFQQEVKQWEIDVSEVGGVDGSQNLLKRVSFSTGTDAEIAAMLDAYYNDEISWENMGWAIGDARTIHLEDIQAPNPNSSNTWLAQDIVVVIVDHDHTDLATPINGHNKACITVQTRECMNNNTFYQNQSGHIYINGDSSADTSFTPWSALYMRTYLNDKVWGAFQTDFKNMIKPSMHYRHTTYNGTGSEQVTDNLFLPSYPEVYGTASATDYVPTSPVEGTQFEYYQTSTNLIKYGNNNGTSNGISQNWWMGSASSYTYSSPLKYYWKAKRYDDAATTGFKGAGDTAYALAPAFAM